MKKLLKVVSYIFVAYPLVATIWQTLPEEVTSLIPRYTEYVALLTSATTFTLGGSALAYLSSVDKVQKDAFAVFNGLYTGYSEVHLSNLNTIERLETVKKNQTKIIAQNERIIELNEANLKVRLSNPYIDTESKELIAKVLGKENEV